MYDLPKRWPFENPCASGKPSFSRALSTHDEMALTKYGYATCTGPPEVEKAEKSFTAVALAGLAWVDGPEKRTLFWKWGRNSSQVYESSPTWSAHFLYAPLDPLNSSLSALTNPAEVADGVGLPMVKHGTACGATTERLALHVEHRTLSETLLHVNEGEMGPS